MNITTKSGFKCKVDPERLRSWDFIKSLVKTEKGGADSVIGITEAVTLLLGEEGEQALCNHLKGDKNYADSADVIAEFKEIMALVNEKK